MDQHHLYTTVELTQRDPMAQQPQQISIPLKPHQLTVLHKAMTMERTGTYHTLYRPPNHQDDHVPATVHTNIGILGDIVGYGKTLEALAIIASTPVSEIHYDPRAVATFHHDATDYDSHLQIAWDRPRPRMLPTTLVIVPHGPVFEQWKRSIADNTSLRPLVINTVRDLQKLPSISLPIDEFYDAFKQWDLVLVKTTTLNQFIQHIGEFALTHPSEVNPATKWARVMIDEAHETLYMAPLLQFHFLWMISATYHNIGHRRSNYRQLMSAVNFLNWAPNRKEHCLVRCQTAFIKASFTIPTPIETNYICKMPYGLNRMYHVLSSEVRQLIDANDFQGVMRLLNMDAAKSESEITSGVLANLERELSNMKHKHDYLLTLDIPEDQRQIRIQQVHAKITDIEARVRYIKEETAISVADKQCSICFEDLKDTTTPPIHLPCAHIFCSQCIFRWTYVSNGTACPTCRHPYVPSQWKAVALSSQSAPSPSVPAPPLRNEPRLKEETLVEIMQRHPEGKFLVFSSFDGSFASIERYLTQANITHAELKGNTAHMQNILQRFRNGEITCILLNTKNTGSGIDISFATDLVLYHSNMGYIREQAIGRAQRVGRTSPLRIHNLVYQNDHP